MFSKIKPYVDLCRVSNLPTVWSNVLTALVVSPGTFSVELFIWIALSMSCFYSVGMCLNDIFDESKDRLDKPFRPIPSGRISLKGAYSLTVILTVAAFLLLLPVPHAKVFGAAVVLGLAIFLYNLWHKAHPATVFVMAFCRLMVFVIAGIGASGSIGNLVWVAGAAQFVYTLVVSMVARYENQREKPFSWPVIPWMIAGMSLLDGLVMALFVAPGWLLAGILAAAMTRYGQRYVRGD